jgi:alpha-glucosidase (family GH31 glycosyl hydrolase)
MVTDLGRNPVAHRGAVVRSGDAEFTLLFPNVVRMQWSEDGRFTNQATTLFINRREPVPLHRVVRRNGWLIIRTARLTVRYRIGSGRFTPTNLRVTYRNRHGRIVVRWRPGLRNGENLGGTVQTLDDTNGPVPLRRGLLSRAGWILLNDSDRPLLTSGPWHWIVPRPTTPHQDWYFFGYGRRYRRALGEFVSLSGRPPLPPEWAFGAWHSRWWKYTAASLMRLGMGYRDHTVPLDVLGIDMDWHVVNPPRRFYKGPIYHGRERVGGMVAGQPLGWTGYTWNRNYFPRPRAYLAWARAHGFKTFLNLHPAGGIQPWEASYPKVARALGLNPRSHRGIPFDLTNLRFARVYFRDVIDPLWREGVTFWWLDWQQYEKTPIPHLRMLWWLNHAFWEDSERHWGDVRPVLYSRWGGWGDQRFGLGFSGDTHSSWRTLRFQPYFTATSANVAFPYWGHDIGGYYSTYNEPPDLFVRWVEWGVFSPLFKVHYWINPRLDRRLWHYPPPIYRILRRYYRLRYRLLPYIYTAAYRTFRTGVAFVHPLYYDWPRDRAAYLFKDEYAFGPDMVVRPVTHPAPVGSLTTREKIWIPPGRWIEWQTGFVLDGRTRGRAAVRPYTLGETPVLVRAGAVVPEALPVPYVGAKPPSPTVFAIFPGRRKGEGRLYSDAGDTRGYLLGHLAWTTLRYRRSDHGRLLRIRISPMVGRYRGMPERRCYEIRLPLTLPPRAVSLDDRPVPRARGYARPRCTASWRYAGGRLATVVTTPPESTARATAITIRFGRGLPERALSGAPALMNALDKFFVYARAHGWPDWRYPLGPLARASLTGQRLTLFPRKSRTILRALPAVARRLLGEAHAVMQTRPGYAPYWALLAERLQEMDPSGRQGGP